MTPSLEDPWRKYKWAEDHSEPFWNEIQTFEQTNPYTIRCEVNADTGEYVFYIEELPEVVPDWGMTIGDIVHNLRSTLDHLAVLLVALCIGQDPVEIDFVQFPVYDESGGSSGIGAPVLQ